MTRSHSRYGTSRRRLDKAITEFGRFLSDYVPKPHVYSVIDSDSQNIL